MRRRYGLGAITPVASSRVFSLVSDSPSKVLTAYPIKEVAFAEPPPMYTPIPEETKEIKPECPAPSYWIGELCYTPPRGSIMAADNAIDPTLALIAECKAKGGEWNGVTCVIPMVDPQAALIAECSAAGGQWNGNSCYIAPPPVDPLLAKIADCKAVGGEWVNGQCVIPQPPIATQTESGVLEITCDPGCTYDAFAGRCLCSEAAFEPQAAPPQFVPAPQLVQVQQPKQTNWLLWGGLVAVAVGAYWLWGRK